MTSSKLRASKIILASPKAVAELNALQQLFFSLCSKHGQVVENKKIEKKGIEFEGKKGPIQQNVFFLLNYRPLLETERFLYLPELLLTTYGLKAQ